jgi:hypothetical protein
MSGNLYLHVIGGSQLTWPPGVVPKEESNVQVSNEDLFKLEMGMSLVIEEIIKSKKPLVGHNPMYDWLYVYNQFVAPLPNSYTDFIREWNSKFPTTFDSKVLAFKSMAFYRTSLGDVFDKCTNDDKFKKMLKFQFDLKGGCVNYDGTAMLSHYHEAAYDAHMTGVSFAQIMKLLQMNKIMKPAGKNEKDKKASKK